MNSAHSGDTIIVDPGNYNGNIDISRINDLNNLVLVSASGPAYTKIFANNTALNPLKGVVSITKSKKNVTVEGFTIVGATRTDASGNPNLAGVYLDQATQCTIKNNVFMDNGNGVNVNTGSGNVISNNIISRTKEAAFIDGNDVPYKGIIIGNSAYAIISQNTISNNNIGIVTSGSSSKGSRISGNSINNNSVYGILLNNYAKGVSIDGNTLNLDGLSSIYLLGSSENQVTNNNVELSGGLYNGTNTNGIQLVVYQPDNTTNVGSNSNVVSNNTVSFCDHGIFVNTGQKNTIQNNTVPNNNYGIAMRYSNNNRIINNNGDGNKEGLYFTREDSGNIISGNSANGCVDAGIHLTNLCGGNNIVDNNIVNSNTYNGIYVEAPSNTISNNFASGNGRGIWLTGEEECYNNTVSNNIVQQSIGSVVVGHGIYLMNTSTGNKVVGNILISNSGNGIELVNSNYSYLDSNYAQDNTMGIQLQNSNWATINNNTADSNGIGFRLYYSSYNNLTMNNATLSTNGGSGIDMNSALFNTIDGNLITWNDGHGITMCPACHYNTVYNNYFLNEANTGVQNSANTWSRVTITKGKNVVGGPYIGGNFWATPNGDGFSQTASDKDGNGIADTSYTFTTNYNGHVATINDPYPLVNVVTPAADFSSNITQGIAPLTVQFTDLSENADSRIWNFGDGTNNSTETNPVHTFTDAGNFTVRLTASNENGTDYKDATITVGEYIVPPVFPVANFNTNPASGYVPLTVQFTDASQYATGWSWTFGDGVNSTDKNTSHTYNSTGTYTVNLTASNANGTNLASKTITVQSHSSGGGGGGSSSSSSSSSGGSGGSGGGSPEPQSNVEVKEISQAFITYGSSVSFDFPQKVTPVGKITFDSKKTVGKTSTIVESLKAKSTLVTGEPSNEIYKYLNIWVGNGGFATENNIGNAVVTFKVAKSWVQDKQIDKSSITLNRYSDNTWKQLSTSPSGEDDSYLYFTAQTAAFSSFAITGKSTATGTVQPGDNKPAGTVSETQNNTSAGSIPANTGNTSEQKEIPSPAKTSPGFETVFAIAGLLAVFLYRRK